MKKNLAVRIGAIVMVLMVAFFSILPDLVSAEGDDAGLLADAEVIAEEQEPDAPEISDDNEIQEPPAEEAPEEGPSEEENPGEETPGTEVTEPDIPAENDPSVTEPSEGEEQEPGADSGEEPEEPGILDEENPSGPTEGTEPADPFQPDQTQPDDAAAADAAETDSGEMDTFDDYLAMLDESQRDRIQGAAQRFENPDKMGDTELMIDEESDFLIEGTTLVKYLGSQPHVEIPAGVTVIGEGAFANCITLQSVTVPEGVTGIQAGAFANCSNLGSISLPSTLAELDRSAFSGDTNLAAISAARGVYSSYDGCIYTGDGRQLLLCPQGKTGVSIASGTASIASGAFNGCGYLLSAVIPDAASSIESNAFSGSSIESVTIPSNVTSIGSQSGWTPNVVYGYSGSTAESWANQNNYVFESLNGIQTEEPERTADEHIEDPDDTEEPEEETETGTRRTTVTRASSGTSGGTTAAISRNAGSRTNATPKTGVEDYGIYFLSAAIFLMGIACFAYSKKLRLQR